MQNPLTPQLLEQILFQRGKVLSQRGHGHSNTFLKYFSPCKETEDGLYQYFNDRNHRNEMLYAIYHNQPLQILDHPPIHPSDFNRQLYSSTFEWYVSEILVREFQFVASAFGVKLDGAPDGGDFDVIGATHSEFIYIECKSGKPRGVDESQLQHFVRRHNFLRSDYSILYIDYKGLDGAFPFAQLSRILRHEIQRENIYKFESLDEKISGNFYAIEGTNMYIVDTSNNTGNIINNLRFTIDSHYALKNLHHSNPFLDHPRLEKQFHLRTSKVS